MVTANGSRRRINRVVAIFAAIASLILISASISDASTFKRFRVEDGLISDTVTSVASDRDGNAWIGTIDGISRYDGAKFEKFTVENGCLKDNAVWTIGVDEGDGYSRIWFGTGFGLAVFEKNHWTHYVGPHENPKTKKKEEGNCPIESNVINKLFVTKNPAQAGKNLIYVVAGGKLYKFNGEKWSTYDFPKDILKTSSITCLAGKGDETLWIGTSGQGLLEFNSSQMRITSYSRKEGLPSEYVTALCAAPDGRVYVGTESGLAIYEKGNFTVYNYRNSKIVSDYVTAISSGVYDNIAIATDRGLNFFDGRDFVPLPALIVSVLSGRVVWAMCYSALPNLNYSQFWIGTRGFGLYLYQVSKDVKENAQEDQTRAGIATFNNKKYQDSLACWEAVIKSDPKNKDAMMYKAKCLIGLDKKNEAAQTLNEVISKFPDQKDPILLLGELYEKDGKYAEALKVYEGMVLQNPKEAEGHMLCAQAQAKIGAHDDAISNYTKAMTINSELPSTYKGLARSLMAKGDYQKALDVSLQLQYKHSDDNENNVNIARIYVNLNKFDQAEDELKKVLAAEEKTPGAKSVLGHVFLEKGSLKEAEKYLVEAITDNFKDANAHAVLALVGIENNNLRNAMDSIANARVVNPYEVMLLYAEGRIFEIEGKFDSAIYSYNRAISEGYNTAAVHYRIANSLKSLEKYDEALREYQRVLAMDPGFKKAEDVKWMISKLSMPTDEELATASTATTQTGQGGKTPSTGSSTGTSGSSSTGGPSVPKPTLDDLDF